MNRKRRFRRGDKVTIKPLEATQHLKAPYRRNWEKAFQYLGQEGTIIDYNLDLGLVDDQYRVYFPDSDQRAWIFDRYLEKV